DDGRCAQTRLAQAARTRRVRRTASRPRVPTDRSTRGSANRSSAGSVCAQRRTEERADRRDDGAVNGDLRAKAGNALRQEMGVAVAREQHELKEHHRRVPNGGRSAEKRQYHLREERLHPEEQERAEENRRAEYAFWHGVSARLDRLSRRHFRRR